MVAVKIEHLEKILAVFSSEDWIFSDNFPTENSLLILLSKFLSIHEHLIFNDIIKVQSNLLKWPLQESGFEQQENSKLQASLVFCQNVQKNGLRLRGMILSIQFKNLKCIFLFIKMKAIILITLLAVFLATALSQTCLNKNNQHVDWYVELIVPNSVSTGYLYFDSTFTSSQFVYYPQEPDTPNTPSYNTLLQINTLSPQFLVWNDELPNGTTSSAKAHSKSIIVFNNQTGAGFTIIHSMPQYPAFIGNQVNITIAASESIYGQHFLCMTANSSMTADIIQKTVIMKPYYYASNLATAPTFTSSNLFEYANYQYGSSQVKFIFKNMKYNSSIFEDGLNNLLNSRIIAETWGRPIDAPWCGTLSTGNANQIYFSSTINWIQTQDHSKWAYAQDNNFSCFGDMNRMSSQWKRGGAFYCINNPLLNAALKKLVPQPVTC